MVQLPPELWLSVVEYLTNDELYTIIGINRFFFDLGMDKKWWNVHLEGHSDTVLKDLNHISDSPVVARKVKRVSVQLLPDPAKLQASNRDVGGSSPSAFSTFRHIVNKSIGKVKSLPTSAGSGAAKKCTSSVMSRTMEVLPLLINVDEFFIMTWGLPPSQDLDDFYKLAWSVMGNRLRSLSVSANLDGYRKFMKIQPSFPALRLLELSFADAIPRDHSASSGEIVPFINSVASQLEVLKIRSFSTLDLSPLFLSIAPMPRLESMLIRIPFDRGFPEDASSFKAFLLRSSSSLKEVDIRLLPNGVALAPRIEEGLQEFLADCFTDPACFANVRCMDIYPTNLSGAVGVLLQAIRNSSRVLTEFTVRDRYLKPEEVLELSKELAHCTQLTYLRVNITYLSCEVFDAVARDLPRLRRLQLSVGESAPGKTASQTLEAVATGMKNRSYPDWNLWDLSVYQSGSELDEETMNACARSIPSLRSFWGRGYKIDLDSQLDAVGWWV